LEWLSYLSFVALETLQPESDYIMGPLFKKTRGRRPPRVDGTCLRVIFRALILPAFLTGIVLAQASDDGCSPLQEGSQLLTAGQVVTRNLRAGETHVFRITLTQGQYLHVVVDQKGIDLTVKLYDPNQTLFVQRDSPNSKFGPEKVSTIAQFSGNYFVVVCGFPGEPSGAYELKVAGLRKPTPEDDARVIAEQTYYRATKLQDLDRAIEYYAEAAKTWHSVDPNEEGYAFAILGDLHRAQKHFTESETSLNTALARLREAGDISGQAYVLNSLGATYRDLGGADRSKGLATYNEALSLRRTMHDNSGEAQTLNNLGLLYAELGKPKLALESLTPARALYQQLGNRVGEMNTLNNIGKANAESGNFEVAFSEINEVLDYCRTLTRPCRLEPYARNTLGMIYDTWAQPNAAVAQYTLALKLFLELPEDTRIGQASALDNLGQLLIGLDDRVGAVEKFKEALSLELELKSPAQEAITRSNLGYVYIVLGNLSDAFDQLDQALLLTKGTNERFEAYTLMRLGIAHSKRPTETAKALERYTQALELQTRIDDIRGQAMTLNYMADLYSSINQPVNARRYYRQAQGRWQAVKDSHGEAQSLYGLAKLEQQQKRLTEARAAIIAATAKIESLRSNTSNYRLRKTFFEARHDFYELEVDIRMQFYNALVLKKDRSAAKAELEQALFTAERARSRNLLDLLNERHGDITQGVDPQLLEREVRQSRQIEEKLESLEDLVGQKGTDAEKSRLKHEFETLNASLDQTRAEIRNRSPRYAALTQPEPLNPAQIQKLLTDDTCLLQYSLGEHRTYLWLVSRNEIRPFTLPGRPEIERTVTALLDVIRAYDVRTKVSAAATRAYIEAPFNYAKRSFELSEMLLKPLSSKLAYKRIIIVADGKLQYVPFGALPLPTDANAKAASAGRQSPPLIVDYEVAFEPSVSVLASIRRDPRRTPPKTVAVIADPVFSKKDPRVQATSTTDGIAAGVSPEDSPYLRATRDGGDIGSLGGPLNRLKYSRKEAEAIVKIATSESSMVALDFDASRATALSPALKQYKIVHLATHGILDTSNPELSGLVFSLVNKQGEKARGFLRLNDIYNLDLDADLVVLSACQTALGPRPKSEALNGLTRGFMYAGAARVVASLWDVDDAATAELMSRFYNYMLVKKMPASAALRQAQLDIPTLNEEWRPTYFWAGFVLQGEWN
jgi:CHAT domain-containing protein/tetratricopeptide (TPR) repeat protein